MPKKYVTYERSLKIPHSHILVKSWIVRDDFSTLEWKYAPSSNFEARRLKNMNFAGNVSKCSYRHSLSARPGRRLRTFSRREDHKSWLFTFACSRDAVADGATSALFFTNAEHAPRRAARPIHSNRIVASSRTSPLAVVRGIPRIFSSKSVFLSCDSASVDAGWTGPNFPD